MANKSGIHINPKHKGEFTAKAKKAGMSVQAFAKHVHSNPDKYSASTRKQAGFAKAATKFKHQAGGDTDPQLQNGMQQSNDFLPMLQNPEDLQPYTGDFNQYQGQGQNQNQNMTTAPQNHRQAGYNGEQYVKDFNLAATGVTSVANAFNNSKLRQNERLQMVKGMTPKYFQNMEAEGLNNEPAYTQFGGHGVNDSDGVTNKRIGPNFKQYPKGANSDTADNRIEEDVPSPDNVGNSDPGYRIPGAPWEHSQNDVDYGYQGIDHNGPYGQQSIYRNGGDVSPNKAKEILHDGTAHGRPLTEQQRKYFGYLSNKRQAGGPAATQDTPTTPPPTSTPPAAVVQGQGGQGAPNMNAGKGSMTPIAAFQSPFTNNDALKQDWNSFLDYTKSQKLQGSKDLDARDKNMGQTLLEGYRKANPNSQLTYDHVKYAQAYINNLRDQRRAQLQKTDPNNPWLKTAPASSAPDGWFGSLTSQEYFPKYAQTSIKNGQVSTKDYGYYQAGGAVRKYQVGGQSTPRSFAVGDEIEMSVAQINALRKQGYQVEEI